MSSEDTLGGAAGRAREKQGQNQDLSELVSEEDDGENDGPVRYTIDFSPQMHQLLRRMAFEEDRSKKDVVIDALQLYANKRGY